ncbi:MAG: RelA/SpoT domain protein [Clostridia bacterium]|jgi:ppGpp synthetase/RelA/SpoT-type nucleotidyltranferase|nr:RelA/SpoT domain protein [Clostridia bacterium]
MELKLFSFIEEVLNALEEMRPSLEEVSEELEGFFEQLLFGANKGYININSRVKSKKSLKEKIIRNDYYQKYDTVETLLENIPDLIGIRLECRFTGDETEIYKFIKKYFNEKAQGTEDYYYNSLNPHVILDLGSKQPKEQKNGIKMYRIDCKYVGKEIKVNFEIQIKSLVNIFWSEIEHKIIYKNYNYVIADAFYKDIMKAIKNSLTTIDQQLLLISNQFDTGDSTPFDKREEQLENLLSKIIYDIFALRMKDSIGVLVDFRKSCEAIVKYVFRDALENGIEKYNNHLIVGFDRLRQIDQSTIDFKEEILFERDPVFKDTCTSILGNHIKGRINEEFQWSLFFRVLFEIEVNDNANDFENYIHYYTDKIYNRIIINRLSSNFTAEETKDILDTLMIQFVSIFTKVNSVELLYDNIVEQVIKIINTVVDALYRNILVFEQWEKEKDIYLTLLQLRLFTLFNMDIKAEEVLDFLERVRYSKSNIEMPKGILKYIYKI